VETEEQARYFASSGRTILAQGWLFGRPLSLEDFLRRMASEEMHQPEAVGAA
jgi:sensor c-di-GMP phosphodiesterase-like protein